MRFRTRNSFVQAVVIAALLLIPHAGVGADGPPKPKTPTPTPKAKTPTPTPKPKAKTPTPTPKPKVKTPTPTPKPKAKTKRRGDDLDALLRRAVTSKPLGGWADKPKLRTKSYPWIEHHGYFRFRADLFYNGHLSTVVPTDPNSGTSAILAPLTENAANNSPSNPFSGIAGVGTQDAKNISSANIRFRYSPTIHISRSLRIHASFDILDNLVLGSTPDFAGNLGRPDVPLVAFSGSQAPPSAGVVGWRDGIRVTEAYADWQPAFLLRVGRMRSQWGLGILSNGGYGRDADFADVSDRVMLLAKFFGVYVGAMYDIVYSGAITDDPGDFFGQPRDLGESDDVTQFILTFFQRPVSAAEKRKRTEDLYENLRGQFDWGVYTVFRSQTNDLSGDSYTAWRNMGGRSQYPFLQLVPRDAWAVIPDLWIRYQKRLNYHSGIRLELEAVAIIGEVGNVLEPGQTGTASREIFQFGAALEFEYQWRQLSTGIDFGVATGDPARGFGVLDRPTLGEGQSPNTRLTAFKFDRNYHVDLLLFREIIGTVTNAIYIKPYIQYDLFPAQEKDLGIRLDLMYAQALEPGATPGGSAFLGAEADLRLFYHEKNRFYLDIEAGFLLPGEAFDYISATNPDNNRSAKFAFSFQTRLTLQF